MDREDKRFYLKNFLKKNKKIQKKKLENMQDSIFPVIHPGFLTKEEDSRCK